jgi:hypothetical protein
LITLAGQKWSVLYNQKPGAQNLNFITFTEDNDFSMR